MIRRSDDEGAVAVTTALLLIVLVMLAAFLVDIGATRTDARADQLLADSAVMAAATFEGNGQEQCRQAVAFLAANVGAGSISDTCGALPATCSSGTAPTPTPPMTIGPYVLVVTHPVAADDEAMQLEGQAVDPDRDGDPCDRIKVEVTRTRDYNFAPIGGANTSGSAANDAVAVRHVEDDPREFATLVVLEQEECSELEAGGGGAGSSGVVIQNAYDGMGNVTAAGVIHLDSNGTSACSGASQKIVRPGSSPGSFICSGMDGRDPDMLTPENEFLIAVFSTSHCEPPAYGRSVLDDTMRVKGSMNVAEAKYLSGGANDHNLEADPVTVDFRITRSLVDHEYNCLHDPDPGDADDTYPTTQPQYPSSGLVEPVPYCTDPNRSPHIDELIAATVGASPPDGFHHVGCSPPSPVVRQYVYINCNTMPSVDFQADVIVLEGGPSNPDGINGGTISVEPYPLPGGAGSTILVVRDGNIRMNTSGDSLTLDRTFVYLHDGQVAITGGDINQWHAPNVQGYKDDGTSEDCEPISVTLGVDVPHPSCFENLALWTNTHATHSMAGQGELPAQGVFFGPNADFQLSGSGGVAGAPMRLEDAQFFVRTLKISGGNGVAMKPNPNIFLETPPPAIALIR